MRRLCAVLLVIVAGCAGAQSPAQRLFVAQANLNAALSAAAAYVAQPECTPALRQGCAEAHVKATIKTHARSAADALAIAGAARAGLTETEWSARIAAATDAATRLVGYLVAEGIIR